MDRFTVFCLVGALALLPPETAGAQVLGREYASVRMTVTATMPRVLVRRLVSVEERAVADGREVSMTFAVGGNIRHRLIAVRRDDADDRAIMVRDAGGALRPLLPGVPVVVSADAEPGVIRSIAVQARTAGLPNAALPFDIVAEAVLH
jgi:hypothetical protein